MYLRYFALQDHPFAITPDPAFLYLSAHHREALGHLLYGTGEYGGFVQLTGEVGTGKTTLIRALLEQEHDVADIDVALCLNPQLTVNELLASICDELHVNYGDSGNLSLKHLVDRLNAHLLKTHAAGRRTVLIIDEAQNLSREVLEQVRLLTNLETRKHKLLRIILVGQPELEDILARPDLRQLAQRITARFHLPGLNRDETFEYIRHRLRVAEGDPHIFTPAACAAVYRQSGGTPRLINTICERALMGAYAREKKSVSPAMVRQAARETLPRTHQTEKPVQQILPVAVLLGAALFAFALHHLLLKPVVVEDTPRQVVGEEAVTNPSEPSGPESTAAVDESNADNVSAAVTQKAAYELPGSDASMSQLLRLWGVFGAEVNPRCRSLKIGDLHCLQGEGSLEVLESFNRPALITLRQGDTSRRVLLSNLDANTATFVFSEGTRQWPRHELTRLWTGEFQMVWRLHSSTRQIGEGSVGNSVVWLRRRLAQAEGINLDAKAGPPSPVFDAKLHQDLRHFQSARGLKPDGLVGARTMIALDNVAPPPGTPLLNSRPQNVPGNSDARTGTNADFENSIQLNDRVCRNLDKLPTVKEVARFNFAANVSRLSDTESEKLVRAVEQLAGNTGDIYITATSYNPVMSIQNLLELAVNRANSTAAGLVKNGIDAKRIGCIAKVGKQAPEPSLDRVAVIYQDDE